MNQALYNPEHGYYASGRARLGRSGDFFTNVSVGPVFGKLMATQFQEIWQQLGGPRGFTIVEQGANDGTFAADVLHAISERFTDFLENLQYWIIEPFPVLESRQRGMLKRFAPRVQWFPSIAGLEPFAGIHFSNELLDAMPFHLVRRGGDQGTDGIWNEMLVDFKKNEFRLIEKRLEDERIAQQLKRYSNCQRGVELEVNLEAVEWLNAISAKLRTGCVLTIDYGFADDGSREPHSTMQCRAGHHRLDSVFDRIGDSDITAHVNWSVLAEEAEALEFKIAGFTDQHHFLTGIISEHEELGMTKNPAARRQLQTLLHPEMMGRGFQVLGLSRGVDAGVKLSGFKFARAPRSELGLSAD